MTASLLDLGPELAVVIGKVGADVIALEVVGDRVFVVREKLGLGGGCWHRRQSVLKKKNKKIVLLSRWCQYTEAVGWPSSRLPLGDADAGWPSSSGEVRAGVHSCHHVIAQGWSWEWPPSDYIKEKESKIKKVHSPACGAALMSICWGSAGLVADTGLSWD